MARQPADLALAVRAVARLALAEEIDRLPRPSPGYTAVVQLVRLGRATADGDRPEGRGPRFDVARAEEALAGWNGIIPGESAGATT